MDIVVQKFGGTSVRDEESRARAMSHIEKAVKEGYKVVVAVSAMGRKGEPYATDTLLSLVDHPNTTLSSREQDLLMSCGEVISSVVFSDELSKAGVSSTALTGAQAGFFTNSDFTKAKIVDMKPDRILQELKDLDVVVVAGFQGKTEEGDVTTFGRGGSDTTAAALGAALNAEYVDIFTDVEGIMTADPRIVESARTMKQITYNEISNLAYQGAKVIHPRAVEIAMHAKVPLRVRSTYSDLPGTLVSASTDGENGSDIDDRLVTGIAHMTGITQIKIPVEEENGNVQAKVFGMMAEAGISVDFINISPNSIVFTIAEPYTEKAKELFEQEGFSPVIKRNCAKVSTVGAGISGVPGVTSKIVNTLSSAGVQILQSADSHTTIWMLIKEEDIKEAVNALHSIFQLSEDI
ncbi:MULTISPECIES: aspartate kinase [Salimicrobium]|uniref:Aspartokinase n=3 Tax=Salimicrobium TaxID=351195 RepID=K2GEV4_9BACI|nr:MULTISPECIES: aspartate kinase [Salimicrobium]AKG04536.1 aspartate kinase [Salimicrobium jeotgali]EKE32747.1 aspartate kinase I [Salimicrobium jeotgali]MBM7695265.1 aspartate kinase [Salimicrobium jeotgali]SDX29991.1 aspartate kinase [Salimicrobium album]SIS64427.1 aspartate kinase [Salimicrobium salexigens]